MARNYISANAKYYKSEHIDRIARHNFRIAKIDYLLPEESIKYQNKNLIFDKNMQEISINNLDKNSQEIVLKSNYLELLNLRENIYNKQKYYPSKKNLKSNDLVEFVVALSEEQALNYLENGRDLMDGFKQYAKDLKEQFGFTPLQVSLHLDEGYSKDKTHTKYNVHAHIVLFNYDFDKQKSILRNLRKKDFQNMQTLAENSFKKVDLDFIRGKQKEIIGKDHLERNELIIAKQSKELNNLQIKVNGFIQIDKELSEQIADKTKLLDELKATRKEIYDTNETLSEEQKQILDELGDEQKGLRAEIKKLREQRKEIKDILSLKSEKELLEKFIASKDLLNEFNDFRNGADSTKVIEL